MSQLRFSGRARRTALFFAVMTLIVAMARVDAAYRVTRPIAIDVNYGYIDQSYLYGESLPGNPNVIHRGVDFPATLDRSVYAVADGVVQDINENGADNCRTGEPNCDAFGNYILVRHARQHFKRTPAPGQMAYVYSLYAHLSQFGALVNVGDNVVAGQLIGQVDNTGNSSGNHLHLQAMLDADPNRTVTYPLSWTETNSRNPELWLSPYNGNTGTVVGKVTYNNGNAYPGVTIYGARSGHNPDGLAKNPAWDYQTSLTYRDGYNLNPDDILVENWGTTDVTPGRYHITLSNGSDMGWHNVQAGRITYVGLYPVWLPEVRNNYNSTWVSTIIVRNNSTTFRAQVNTTFFNLDGTVRHQRTDYINAKASANLDVPANWEGSATVVSSEDVAVIVRNQNGDELTEYNGIMASGGSLGWEQVGSTLYAPVVKNSLGGRSSRLLIFNAGSATAIASVQFYDGNGAVVGNDLITLAPNASGRIYPANPPNPPNCPNPPGLCSAKIWSSNGQPLAVSVLERTDGSTNNRATHNACNTGTTANFVPLVKKNAGGQSTGIAVQNLGTAATNLSLTCYPSTGNSLPCGTRTSVPPLATAVFIMNGADGSSLPDGFIGSAVVNTSGRPVATLIYESGDPFKLSTNALLAGSATVYAPQVYGNYLENGQTWNTGLSIQNVGSVDTTVTATYYDTSGNYVGQWTSVVGPKRSWIVNASLGNLPTNNFSGNALIQSAQPIAAVVNVAHTGSGDTKANYTASNR